MLQLFSMTPRRAISMNNAILSRFNLLNAGTAPFMRASRWPFSRGRRLSPRFIAFSLYYLYFRGVCGVSPPAAAFHFLFLPPCWLMAYFYRLLSGCDRP
ncbi:hypothetical protein KCP71_19705 [Salmonella enterica subsp. enterica]|nr:hypothetical protein KCP71_19705 [Salmonella enterica subsp. enterica]